MQLLPKAAVLVATLLAASTASAQDAPAVGVDEVPEGQPRYLAAMERELSALGIAATCEADGPERAACTYEARGQVSSRSFAIRILYSDRTDTLYLHVPSYLSAPADGAHTMALLCRLMELNWRLLLGKFEWDAVEGEVRLAMVLNTDSNFDRRAFRSAVRGIAALADRYYDELSRVQARGVREGACAAP
jgi:hypothetical protein